MEEVIGKARVLLEALPYIRKFRGRFFVVKFGGSVLADKKLGESIITDIVFLSFVGIKPVLVHGGGPGITAALKNAGIESNFLNGLRVTCGRTMEIVQDVLFNGENAKIAGLIRAAGGEAERFDGRRGGIMGRKLGGEMGRVGEIAGIEPGFLRRVKASGSAVPVVCPVGCSDSGESLNINADDVAAEIAASIPAEKLVLVTDVEGITGESGVYSTLRVRDAERLISSGVVRGGMIPKVKACIAALERGVAKAHMVNGNTPHALLLEIFTDEGAGTEIVRN